MTKHEPDNVILTAEERREQTRQKMIETILRVAREDMREDGVASLSLHRVAKQVGMRVQSLYNYFPSKAAIYEALFRQGMQMFYERQEQVYAHYGPTWKGMQHAIEAYFAFALENPELYQLLFERPVPGFVPSPEGLEESQRLLDFGRRWVTEAIAADVIHPDISVDEAVNLLIALMHGITAQHLANEPHLPLGEGRFGSLIPGVVDLLRKVWG